MGSATSKAIADKLCDSRPAPPSLPPAFWYHLTPLLCFVADGGCCCCCLNRFKQLRFVEQRDQAPSPYQFDNPFPALYNSIHPLRATLESQKIVQHRLALLPRPYPPPLATPLQVFLPPPLPLSALSDIWAKSFEWQPQNTFPIRLSIMKNCNACAVIAPKGFSPLFLSLCLSLSFSLLRHGLV